MKDYSGRRPVPKNRPRKQPAGIFVIILISAVSMSFALGVLTGWVIHRPALKAAQNQLRAGENGAADPRLPRQNPEAGAPRGVDPPLTFYETLPKGGKAIMGSGLNPKKTEEPASKPPDPLTVIPPQAAAPAPPAAAKPAVKEQGKVAEPGKKISAVEPPAAQKQSDAGPGKFCIQISSTQVQKEAEVLKAKLVEKGLPVYITESVIKDRGTWFRVRAGKHLSQQAAGELAVKIGKGAIVIPE